jgi:hypothetical protein
VQNELNTSFLACFFHTLVGLHHVQQLAERWHKAGQHHSHKTSFLCYQFFSHPRQTAPYAATGRALAQSWTVSSAQNELTVLLYGLFFSHPRQTAPFAATGRALVPSWTVLSVQNELTVYFYGLFLSHPRQTAPYAATGRALVPSWTVSSVQNQLIFFFWACFFYTPGGLHHVQQLAERRHGLELQNLWPDRHREQGHVLH